jgi:hypothetical protein
MCDRVLCYMSINSIYERSNETYSSLFFGSIHYLHNLFFIHTVIIKASQTEPRRRCAAAARGHVLQELFKTFDDTYNVCVVCIIDPIDACMHLLAALACARGRRRPAAKSSLYRRRDRPGTRTTHGCFERTTWPAARARTCTRYLQDRLLPGMLN